MMQTTDSEQGLQTQAGLSTARWLPRPMHEAMRSSKHTWREGTHTGAATL